MNLTKLPLLEQYNKLVKGLLGYSCNYEIINPKDLGIKQNRPRLFVWANKIEQRTPI